VLTYILTFLVPVLLFALGFGQPGVGNGGAYVLLSALTAFSGLLVGALSLIRFYVRKRSVYVWVGIGLVGSSVLEAYHVLAVGRFLPVNISADAAAVEPWAWLAGRTALALFFLLSWALLRRKHQSRQPTPTWSVYTIVFGATAASLAILVLAPPPGPYWLPGVIGRPFELLPAVAFLVALIGYLVDGDWRKSSFDHSLIVALILGTAGHALLLAFSREPYDTLFYLGTSVELASTLVLAVGLLVSTYRVFRLTERRRMESLRTTFDLTKERTRVTSSLEELREKEAELRRKVAELETTRKAVLNIMEDLDVERSSLASEKAKDEAILASVGEGLVVTDERRRVTFLNTAAEQMIGYSSGDVVGKLWPEVVKPKTEDSTLLESYDTLIVKALRLRKTRSTIKPEVFTRKDGTTFSASITVAPVIMADRPTGAIVVFRDVTREREIDKAKSEFVSLASHQLRTPLSTIKWYVEMVLDGDAGKLTPTLKDYLSEVYHANERMVDLVNALLNVSRIELGTFAVQPVPTDVAAVAKSVVSEVKPQAISKKITVSEKYAAVPKLPADPNLLRIVFQNLVTNAIKYTAAKGKVAVGIELVRAHSTVVGRAVREDSILITVADNGYGIPTAAQPKIFTKLFRADNVREREPDGTGLGLYIVKSVVDHSDGDVWFESVEGKGTTFYVLLPVTGMRAKEGAKQLT